MREILPALDIAADLVLADPPYGETSLPWDRWVAGWPDMLAVIASSLWCFGSLRMYMQHASEFAAAKWRFSQDVIWEKHNGSGFAADRFRRVHEIATFWYRGRWREVYRDVQVTMDAAPRVVRRKHRPPHTGHINRGDYVS